MRETAESSRARYWQRFESTGKVEDYLQYSCGGGARETIKGCSKANLSDSDQHNKTDMGKFGLS